MTTRGIDDQCTRPSRLRRRSAFTLLEILIAVAIIGVLIALLIPALSGAIGTSRRFRCQMSIRSTAFDFSVFADESLHGERGDDEHELPKGSFRLETFQEQQYGIDEFWLYGNAPTVALPDRQGRDPMRCSEIRAPLTVRRNVPCSDGGVGPPASVSYAFNVRLQYSETQFNKGNQPQVLLTSRILLGNGQESPARIPLVFDVDGAAAGRKGQSGVLAGPSLDSRSLFTGNAYWFPAKRHLGTMNVAFIDGHVDSSKAPLEESDWSWNFDAGN